MSPHGILKRLYGDSVGYDIQDPGASGTISVDRQLGLVKLVSAAAESRTLPAPLFAGAILTLNMKTDGGDITLTVTGGYDEAGNTSIVFSATGQFVMLVSVEEGANKRWRVVGYDGVTGPSLAFDNLLVDGKVTLRDGGTVTQGTNKQTGVTLSTLSGQITMNNEALGAGAETSFTVTNTKVAATDVVVVNHGSAGTAGAYLVGVNAVGAGSFGITVSNVSAGSLSEAIVLNFVVLGGSAT